MFPSLVAFDWLQILVLLVSVPALFGLLFLLVGIVTWTLYLAIMRASQVSKAGKMPRGALPFAYAILAVGYLVDFIFNLLATFVFLELPREWLFSGRVSRHALKDSWRGKLARWFCQTLLDPFDPSGCHCRGKP